jgi:Uma2 family endonuclease
LDKLDKKGCVGAPDLVVEILSKQNDVRDLKDKFEVYEEFGVREYWIVNPINESVLIYVLNEFGKYIGLKPFVETEIQSTIFPQFSITTEEIFRE